MLQIAIAEDNATERGLLKKAVALQKNCHLLFDAMDGWDTLKKLQVAKKLPDILLLDMNMPYVNGLIITIYCAFKYPSIKIIGVSSHTNENLVREVITEGALAFISKYFLYPGTLFHKLANEQTDELAAAIAAVLKNQIFISKLVVNNPDAMQLSVSTKTIIAANYKHIKEPLIAFAILNAADLDFKKIAALMCITEHTVKKYSGQIAILLKVTNRSQLTNHCMQHGIIKLATFFDTSVVHQAAWD